MVIKMNDKISIVVPIYGVEDYLEECVYSLINQDYKNLEIILVDDGSKDKCPQICDKLGKIDERIKVFHKENGGLSSARNYGIKRATGKYIAFVDSDDYVKSDYISFMYKNLIENDVKISACGYSFVYPNGTIERPNYKNIEKKYELYEAEKYLNLIGYFNVASWNKLYDVSLFDDIEFPLGKKSEDWFIMYKLIEKANGIYYNSLEKYMYRQRKGSITKNSNVNIDCIEASKNVLEHFKNTEIKKWCVQSYIFALIGVYNNFFILKNDKEKMKELRNLALEYKEDVTYEELSTSRKIQLFLFLNFKGLYNFSFKLFDIKRNFKFRAD